MANKNNANLGEFICFPDHSDFQNSVVPREKPQIYFSDDLISIYSAFRNHVYNAQYVLYPSCGFDASPIRIFDNVTFVDIEDGNDGCVNALQANGLHALKQDIRSYVPSNGLHDLLILLNPSIPTEWASRHLKSGGYILANDYHGNASEMYENPDKFTLWGTISFAGQDIRKKDYDAVVVSQDLDGLFQPVKNSEEFKKVRPNDFKFTKDMVFSFVQRRYIKIDLNASFEEKWAAYRAQMHESMPYRRVADRYIFVKK